MSKGKRMVEESKISKEESKEVVKVLEGVKKGIERLLGYSSKERDELYVKSILRLLKDEEVNKIVSETKEEEGRYYSEVMEEALEKGGKEGEAMYMRVSEYTKLVAVYKIMYIILEDDLKKLDELREKQTRYEKYQIDGIKQMIKSYIGENKNMESKNGELSYYERNYEALLKGQEVVKGILIDAIENQISYYKEED